MGSKPNARHDGVMTHDGHTTQGLVIQRTNFVCTTLFIVTALYAAIVFDTIAQWVGAVTAMTLFAIGVATFLWGFWNAVQRSRHEDIAVSEVYFLLRDAAPRGVRRSMNAMLLAQIITAFGTTFARTSGPDGRPGSSLAVGILVPVLGIGLNGLWSSRYGKFPRRAIAE